jgi:uncharacterized protein
VAGIQIWARTGLALLIASGLLVAGCGSSDDEPAATTSPPEKEAPALDRLPQAAVPTGPPPGSTARDPETFLREVFDDAEAFWRHEFGTAGLSYRPAKLTFFRDAVDTACGRQPGHVGPFYCPADAGVYLDLRFFDALSARSGVRLGRFAQAYVIAHELGHHVQTQLSLAQRKAAADQRDPAGANARSSRFELQADCLAGVWMHSAYRRGDVSDADIEDALRAAAVVGSDFQQFNSTGTIRPEDWTHGSSAQRRHWLTVGFEKGRPSACDTGMPGS